MKKMKGLSTNCGYRIIRGCKVQHTEHGSQRTYMRDPWTWTMVWGLPEGVGVWVEKD